MMRRRKLTNRKEAHPSWSLVKTSEETASQVRDMNTQAQLSCVAIAARQLQPGS